MNSGITDVPAESTQLRLPSASEYRVVALIIFLVVFLTTVPYVLAYSVGSGFVGQIYNIVDYSVYLSWTRQAADGHFATLNLFTTIKQHGYLFNLLFLFLGNIVRITGLPIPIVFQIVRIVGAVFLLWTAYLICRLVYPGSVQARLTSLGLIAFSSGFGFLYWPKWADNNAGSFPVDVWQPEAFTFLSIYTSVLFVVATTFILIAMYNLLQGELTGKMVHAVYAGICALILGNIHSYDILHIAAAWGTYLVGITVVEMKFDKDRWMRAVIAGSFALPSTLYQYWVFKHETVFRLRALTPTLSPSLFYYAMGYGLVFFLALGAVGFVAARKSSFIGEFNNQKVLTATVGWAIAGLTIIYLPVEFQRKMAMGEHIPLCLLAGGFAAFLVAGITGIARTCALCAVVLATFPSNALFLTRELHHVEYNRSEIADARPFLTFQQIEVLSWIRHNTHPGEAVLALPPIGQFVPGYCDRPVWVGHWSETPHYGAKITKLIRMLSVDTPDMLRIEFFDSTGATYLVYPSDASENPIPTKRGPIYLSDFRDYPVPYLTEIYETPATPLASFGSAVTSPGEHVGGYTIYRINH